MLINAYNSYNSPIEVIVNFYDISLEQERLIKSVTTIIITSELGIYWQYIYRIYIHFGADTCSDWVGSRSFPTIHIINFNKHRTTDWPTEKSIQIKANLIRLPDIFCTFLLTNSCLLRNQIKPNRTHSIRKCVILIVIYIYIQWIEIL